MKTTTAMKRLAKLGFAITDVTADKKHLARYVATKTANVHGGIVTVYIEFHDFFGEFEIQKYVVRTPTNKVWTHYRSEFTSATDVLERAADALDAAGWEPS
jgi:hypothetical protein